MNPPALQELLEGETLKSLITKEAAGKAGFFSRMLSSAAETLSPSRSSSKSKNSSQGHSISQKVEKVGSLTFEEKISILKQVTDITLDLWQHIPKKINSKTYLSIGLKVNPPAIP